jgi:hypothetical protein
VGAYLRGLVLRSLIAAPDLGASYADVVGEMHALVTADGKPADYAGFVRDRFSAREVVVVEQPGPAPSPLPQDVPNVNLLPGVCDAPGAVQDRRACCGTMNLPEYYNVEAILAQEVNALAQWCAAHGRTGPAG